MTTTLIAQGPVDVPVRRHLHTVRKMLERCREAVEPSLMVLGDVRADEAIAALAYMLPELEAEVRFYDPPCMECGAKTPEEAEKLCNCGGDKDDCHGCQLWPDR